MRTEGLKIKQARESGELQRGRDRWRSRSFPDRNATYYWNPETMIPWLKGERVSDTKLDTEVPGEWTEAAEDQPRPTATTADQRAGHKGGSRDARSEDQRERHAHRWTKETANAIVAECLRQNLGASVREINKQTGIPCATIGNTDAWKLIQRHRRAEGQPYPKATPISDELMEMIASREADPLGRLVKEQQADIEPSPLDKHGTSQVVYPRV